MAPLAIEIGGITVEAKASLMREPRLILNGFVRRVQRGLGRFITPRDIQESQGMTVGDVLAKTGRVTSRYSIGGDRILMRGRGGPGNNTGYCNPVIWVDGVRLPLNGVTLDDFVQLTDVDAIEIYRSVTQAPIAFGGSGGAEGEGGCGVILIWTRRR